MHPKGTVTVCPMGLCRTQEDCPNAPCLDCMHRLGEHLIEEVRILQRHAVIAAARQMPTEHNALSALIKDLGLLVTSAGVA